MANITGANVSVPLLKQNILWSVSLSHIQTDCRVSIGVTSKNPTPCCWISRLESGLFRQYVTYMWNLSAWEGEQEAVSDRVSSWSFLMKRRAKGSPR